jgi:hypothetical protein
MFIDFVLIDKLDRKPLSETLDQIEEKIADISDIESRSIRLGNSASIDYNLYEKLVFYREVLIESFCGSSCVPYSKSQILSKINSLLYKNC